MFDSSVETSGFEHLNLSFLSPCDQRGYPSNAIYVKKAKDFRVVKLLRSQLIFCNFFVIAKLSGVYNLNDISSLTKSRLRGYKVKCLLCPNRFYAHTLQIEGISFFDCN